MTLLISPSSSCVETFRLLPLAERIKRLDRLTAKEEIALAYDWHFHARPNQLAPAGDWNYWIIMAGRGYGKSRSGAEWVREQVRHYPYVNVIGATSDDARDIMITGESGIMAVCPKDERPRYLGHKRQLEWPNGAKTLVFTADEPDRLRGHQHMKLWCDELAAWRYPEAWDQAAFGLRLGDKPQALITTTPRPSKIIRTLLSDPKTIVVRGSTYENKANLADSFLASIIKKYEGTRLGRQELHAEILSDNPHALWKRDTIEALRIAQAPVLKRIVVAIDPAVTGGLYSDETGIIVLGIGEDNHGYVLEDCSVRATPDQWAHTAVAAYHRHQADRIIGECNNGGDIIESLLRTIDTNIAYKPVYASHGKYARAEPISALYEQGKIHHVGSFSKLEDQLCDWTPSSKTSPDRLDALVWGLSELMLTPHATGMLDYYAQWR